MPMTRTVHVFIGGRVQRVGYRKWAAGEAERLGLRGWVRNLSDGRVEAVFSGAEDIVAEMIGLCHQGPRFARVDGVEISDVSDDGLPGAFERRETL